MRVLDIAPRRKGYAALSFSSPVTEKIEGEEREGERLLIDRVILARLNITKGSELELDDIKQLVYVSESYRAKQRAFWYLNGRDYSEKALYDKLCGNFSPKAAAFAVSVCKEKGFLDDERYAKRLIKSLGEKNLSRRGIETKLYLKGVPKGIIERTLGDENLFETEVQRAKSLINSKYKNKLSDENSIRKTVQALQRRGFSYSDIKKALDGILEDVALEENC